jgi:hypothetical protein
MNVQSHTDGHWAANRPRYPLSERFAEFLRSPECGQYLDHHTQVVSKGDGGRAPVVSVPSLSWLFRFNTLLVQGLGLSPEAIGPGELEAVLSHRGPKLCSANGRVARAQLGAWWRFLGRTGGAEQAPEVLRWLDAVACADEVAEA